MRSRIWTASSPRLLRLAFLLLALSIAFHARLAAAQSGVQITPDGEQILISKDVGNERWAMALNAEDGTVTGNVFLPGGGEPQFVWCEDRGRSGTDVTLGCYGADVCPLAPCSVDEWTFITYVTLPESFFRPPAPTSGEAAFAASEDDAGVDAAPSGLQVTLDRKHNLISKDVGDERWAITYNLAGHTVTGNVFFPGGGEPRFVWCAETGGDDQSVDLACSGADRCIAVPCNPDAWSFIANVTLPRSFLVPRD